MRASDAIGGGALSWSNEGDVWARVEPSGAGRGVGFDTAPAVSRYRLAINRREDVRAGWRVLWGARVLRIVGVRDEGAARIDLICEEETL